MRLLAALLIFMFVFILISTPEDIKQQHDCPDFSDLSVGESETIRRRGINYTYVSESFHDYIIVEGKRVIHPHNCKCKKQ